MGTGFALALRFCGTLWHRFIGGAGFGGGTGNGVRFGDGNGGCDGRSGKGGGGLESERFRFGFGFRHLGRFDFAVNNIMQVVVAADDAALGIADHTAGVKDIGAGGNAGGDKGTDNVNRIGHGVWQVFDIAIVRVGDGDGCTGSGGEFAVGDGFNIDAGNHAEGFDGGGANVDFVRGEVENLGRHGAVLPFMLRSFVACGFVFEFTICSRYLL